VDTQPGFLKGIVDLIFCHHSKYYILDWKSNWLGPTAENYGQESMKQSMQEHSYDLQAALYSEALKRYLGVVDNISFDDTFGGAYYIFLRGIGPHTKNREGIYAIETCKESLCQD